MKILIIGDPHFKPSTVDLMKKFVEETLLLIDKKKPDLVVVLGDTLDTKEKINIYCLNQAIDFFLQIVERTRLVVLIGNHDFASEKIYLCPHHPFTGLSHERLMIVNTPKRDPTYPFFYIPYVPTSRLRDALLVLDYDPEKSSDHPLLIFSHQEYEGCQMGAMRSEHGDKWSEDLPLTIAGHIHDKQDIPGVIYPGTPIQHKYGETPNKSVLLIDIDTTLRGIAKDILPKITREEYFYSSVPRKQNVHLTYEDIKSGNIDKKLPKDPSILLKVIVKVKQEDSKAVKNLPAYKRMLENVEKRFDKVMLDIEFSPSTSKITTDKIGLFDKIVKELGNDIESICLFKQLYHH